MRLSHLLGVILLSAVGCLPAHAEADLKIYGSNTVGAELGPALIREWLSSEGYTEISEELEGTETLLSGKNRAGKSLTVELDAQGSSTGFRALQDKKAHIGMSSRPIKAQEVEALKPLGRCDTAACEYVIALDGIAVIVNQQNPLSKIRKQTLKRLFSGEVTDWAQIGGKAGPVHVYALDENSGTFDTFKSLVLGKGNALVAGARRDASHAAISAAVANDANAIGFVGLPFVNASKAVAVADGEANHIAPTPFTVATEDYVLARRLFFYLPEKAATPLAKQFVEFAVSDTGQQIAEGVGFISQEVIAGEPALDENAPQEYRELTDGGKRLSLNFRFLPGTTKLDNKAQRDVARLKAFMQQPENRSRELMLFGFADSHESMPIVSLQLSTERADNVADLLIKEGLRPGKVRGYGSAVPVASNETEAGQSKNRRVEVWVR
jgi:phosphate transport system substrate-binding protein